MMHLNIDSKPRPRSLSELLIDLKASLTGDTISVNTVLEGFHERGFGFFLFLLGLVSAVPIPAMGMHSVIAIPMFLLTAQQVMGRHIVWMPHFIRRQTMPRGRLEKLIDHCIPWAQKLEKISRPRMGYMTQGVWSHVIGALGLLMVTCIIIPLPLTNTVPAIGLVFMSAGILVRDGLAVVIGAFVGSIWSLAWFAGLAYLGPEGVRIVSNYLLSFFH